MSSSSLRDFVSETGRKAWRKTKERTGSVWTPVLEASLIEALEKYRPTTPPRDNKRPTRALLRFPKRNQYISAHIFATTGVRRTPKQVGSRLRQLQEVCEDARILNLIFRRDFAQDSTIDLSMPFDSSASLDDASSAAPSPVASASDYSDIADDAGLPPRTYITIELVQPSSSFAPDEQNIRSPPTNPNPNQHFISLEYPSDIETNDPVLAFSTFKKISTSQYYSYFRVLIGGVFVHSEVAELTFASSPPRPGPSSLVEAQQRYTYNIKLVPQYWAHLCRTAQLFQCVIEQDIIRAPAPFALDALPVAPGPSDQCIRSVTYEFSSVRSSSSSRTTTAPLPAFHPPPLASEPRLAPDFPAVGYGFNTSRQAPIPMESTGCMSQAAPLPLPLYRPPSPSTKYTSPSEQVFYAPDGSLVATPTPTPFGSISSSTGAFLYNAVASALPMPSSSYANYPYSYPSCPPSSLPSDEDIINAPYDYYDYDFQQPQPHPNSNQAYTYDTSYTYNHPYPTPYSIPATTYNPTAETSFWSQYCSLEQQNSNTDSF